MIIAKRFHYEMATFPLWTRYICAGRGVFVVTAMRIILQSLKDCPPPICMPTFHEGLAIIRISTLIKPTYIYICHTVCNMAAIHYIQARH